MRTPLSRLVCLLLLLTPMGCSDNSSTPLLDLEFTGSFGSFGDRQGRSMYPTSLALDSAGNTYVADQATYQIRKISPEGDFIQAWGGWGRDPGKFETSPVLYCRQDRIYATTRSLPGRVQIFSTEGVLLEAWDLDEGNGQPIDLAVDTQGRLYVLGGFAAQGLLDPHLYRYSPQGEHASRLEGWYQGSTPISIEFGPEDEVRLLYGTGTISELDENGAVVSTRSLHSVCTSLTLAGDGGVFTTFVDAFRHFDDQGVLLAETTEPGAYFTAMNVGGDGLVHVADSGNLGVSVYSPDGQLQQRQELRTEGQALFRGPWCLATLPGFELGVFDSGNERLMVFTREGSLQRVLDLGPGLVPVFAADPDGNLYVLRQYRGVRKLTPSGELVWEWNTDFGHSPLGVAVTQSGRVYVLDLASKSVFALDQDGNEVWEKALPEVDRGLWGGVGVAPDGGVFVVGTAELTHLSPEGEILRRFPVEADTGPGITTDAQGRILLTNYKTGAILAYNMNGRLVGRWEGKGTDLGELLAPAGIVLMPGGDLFISDAKTNRISRFWLSQDD